MTNYLYISTVFISIVLALFFSFHNWAKSPLKKLISLQLWIISYGLFVNYLSIKGFFIEWPHFSRTALICLFLTPSILFLSIYRELYKKTYRWYDLFHFIPVTIYILNYSPYYILSAEEKIKILSNPNLEKFNEGILPSYFLLILTIVQISMYIIWLYSIFRGLKQETKNHPILTLIKYFMGYMSLQFLLVMVTIHYYFGTYHLNEIFTIIYALGNIFFSFKVLSTPVWIFEPLDLKNDSKANLQVSAIETGNIEERVADKIKAKSENIRSEEDLLLLNQFLSLIKDPKVFLDPDFSQKKISKKQK